MRRAESADGIQGRRRDGLGDEELQALRDHESANVSSTLSAPRCLRVGSRESAA